MIDIEVNIGGKPVRLVQDDDTVRQGMITLDTSVESGQNLVAFEGMEEIEKFAKTVVLFANVLGQYRTT